MSGNAVRKLIFCISQTPCPWSPLIAAHYIGMQVEYSNSKDGECTLTQNGITISKSINPILRSLMANSHPINDSLADYWLDFSKDNLFSTDFKTLAQSLKILETHLNLRSFFVAHSIGFADFAIWGALKQNVIFNKQIKTGTTNQNLSRWFSHMNSLDFVIAAMEGHKQAKTEKNTIKGDHGKIEMQLENAVMGKVVTRFPPEPSGYLHIGHAKAALLNDYFAKAYKGRLIVRFDDTNPSKEKIEYETSINEDLTLLGITPDIIVHTSDHFEKLYDYALQLIKLNLAYCDDTGVETMRNERFDGIESKNRQSSILQTLELFEEMRRGTVKGLTFCLRARMNMSDKNKCMRDPVIYRCNTTPHHIHGDSWKMYPTYDFACPIVDSLDGVTHALRTVEYRDRNPQYVWFLKSLNLRMVNIWDFRYLSFNCSRLNFIFTLLSKRKLTWFVEEKLVSGWDDPRFPTVRGIRRRGMTIEALRSYIIMQGASQRELSLEWDKIWAINKKVIDPCSSRHTALLSDNLVTVVVSDVLEFSTKLMPRHKKNLELGEKLTNYGSTIFLEQNDCTDLSINEELTLMDWGNVIVEKITKQNNIISKITVKLNLEGDYKKTKKKLTWLSPGQSIDSNLTNILLLDYDYLINKKKLDEGDDIKDFLNPQTEFKSIAIGDSDLKNVKDGEIIQLERKGYFICDRALSPTNSCINLIQIPDGKAESIALKGPSGEKEQTREIIDKKVKDSINTIRSLEVVTDSTPDSKMYHVDSIHKHHQMTDSKTNDRMYAVKSFYSPNSTLKIQESKMVAGLDNVISRTIEVCVKEQKEEQVSDIVVGKILDVKKHPDADTLYLETIDVGEAEPRQVVSGLVKFMEAENMRNKLVLVVRNLKPVAMRGVKSYAMVLCASNSDHTVVEFLVPPPDSIPGEKVFFKGHAGIPSPELKPKKKVWETLQVDFKTREDLVAVWKGVPFETSKGLVKSETLANAAIK